MEHYRDTRFIPEDAVPVVDGDLVARQSPWGHLFASAVLFTLSIGVPAMIASTGFSFPDLSGARFDFATLVGLFIAGVAGFVVLGVGLTCLLGGFLFLSSAVAAFKPTNWVLRAGPAGLYIKLRSYTDYRLPKSDPIVLHIPRRAVRRLHSHEEQARHINPSRDDASADDDTLTRQHYLEIEAYGDALADVGQRLETERSLYGPTVIKGMTSKAKGSAISLRDGSILRVDWKTKRSRLTPNLREAIAYLSKGYVVGQGQQSAQAPIRTLSQDGQEARLLDLVEQGNVTDAVILARDIYGFNLTEAKAFLDDLQRA